MRNSKFYAASLQNKSWPLITIVIPSFNQQDFLEASICSIVKQNYPNLEFIIMDGGSTDGSIDIILKYEKFLSWWETGPDGGQAEAINRAWRNSTGDIVAWLNSDDLYCEDALMKVAAVFSQNAETAVVFGDCIVINRAQQPIVTNRPIDKRKEDILLGQSLSQPSVFIHRRVLNQVGYLNSRLHYALDWAFVLKVLFKCHQSSIFYLPENLAMSREYDGTKSRTGLSDKGDERRSVLAQYYRNGILGDLDSRQYCEAFAGTYWVQGIDEFMANKLVASCISAAKATYYSPISLLKRLSKIWWPFKERYRRFRSTR